MILPMATAGILMLALLRSGMPQFERPQACLATFGLCPLKPSALACCWRCADASHDAPRLVPRNETRYSLFRHQ
jgi:hypothetical protein